MNVLIYKHATIRKRLLMYTLEHIDPPCREIDPLAFDWVLMQIKGVKTPIMQKTILRMPNSILYQCGSLGCFIKIFREAVYL